MPLLRLLGALLTALACLAANALLGYLLLQLLHAPIWLFAAAAATANLTFLFLYLNLFRLANPSSLPPWHWKRSLRRRDEARAWADRKRTRIAELRLDPHKARYIPFVERGRIISDDEIAYLEDPSATRACPHLAPVELALRQAGIETDWWPASRSVRATCVIDLPRLRQLYPAAAPRFP